MNSDKKWMIYGANGYTGKLVVKEAIRRGLKPVLAGRSTEVVAIASKNGLESKVFSLSSIDWLILDRDRVYACFVLSIYNIVTQSCPPQ